MSYIKLEIGIEVPRDPFDEFRKIEKLFQKVMEGKEVPGEATSRSISVRRTSEGTKVNVQGDVPEEEIERLKREHPDAEISVSGRKVESSGPVEVVDEERPEETEEREESRQGAPVVEEVDEEEMEPEELALKRHKEKKQKE